jgi:hypothetical protein
MYFIQGLQSKTRRATKEIMGNSNKNVNIYLLLLDDTMQTGDSRINLAALYMNFGSPGAVSCNKSL